MSQREINRNPAVPFLSDEVRAALTRLFFKQDDAICKADMLFVFGTTRQATDCADGVSDLLSQGIADTVLITGGVPDFDDKHETGAPPNADASSIFDHINKSNLAQVTFFIERTSQNTLENVVHGLQVMDFSHFARVAYVATEVHALRASLTLQKYISSGTQLLRHTYPTTGRSGMPIDQATWHMSIEGVAYIWGEFERIRLYGKRGDIAFEGVRQEIERIQELVA